jgi:hypothetical protein
MSMGVAVEPPQFMGAGKESKNTCVIVPLTVSSSIPSYLPVTVPAVLPRVFVNEKVKSSVAALAETVIKKNRTALKTPIRRDFFMVILP